MMTGVQATSRSSARPTSTAVLTGSYQPSHDPSPDGSWGGGPGGGWGFARGSGAGGAACRLRLVDIGSYLARGDTIRASGQERSGEPGLPGGRDRRLESGQELLRQIQLGRGRVTPVGHRADEVQLVQHLRSGERGPGRAGG